MKKRIAYIILLALAFTVNSATSADLIYDNGDADGSGAHSNINNDDGLDRKIADDFILVGGPGWIINQVAMNYIWNSVGSGGATGFLVEFFADDAGGGPGTLVSSQLSTDFTETATGNTYFGRPEQIMLVDISNVALNADTNYWVSIQTQGIENGFQLLSHSPNVIGDEAYVFYPDLGHKDWVTGTFVFGYSHDMSFKLYGEAVPAPGVLAMLGFAGLVGVRRRHR